MPYPWSYTLIGLTAIAVGILLLLIAAALDCHDTYYRTPAHRVPDTSMTILGRYDLDLRPRHGTHRRPHR